jgi:preprotein translocase subunit YajC
MNGLFFILILLGAAWVLLMIPARRRRGQHEAMQDSVDAGDEIITAGGIHGTVKEIEGGTAKVEIALGVVVTLDRRAIAAVASDVVVAPGEVEHEDPAPGTDVEPR